jgi:hypothetical protein
MGVDYWRGLIEWMRSSLQGTGRIGPADLDLITLTDDVDEAIAAINASL